MLYGEGKSSSKKTRIFNGSSNDETRFLLAFDKEKPFDSVKSIFLKQLMLKTFINKRKIINRTKSDFELLS